MWYCSTVLIFGVDLNKVNIYALLFCRNRISSTSQPIPGKNSKYIQVLVKPASFNLLQPIVIVGIKAAILKKITQVNQNNTTSKLKNRSAIYKHANSITSKITFSRDTQKNGRRLVLPFVSKYCCQNSR